MIVTSEHAQDEPRSCSLEPASDSSALPIAPQRLPMRTDGIGIVFTCFLLYAGVAVVGFAASLTFVVKAFTDSPGDCAAGWVGGVGLSISFMALAYIFGSLAFRGLRASITANRNVGSVTLDDDSLVIESPGVLASPATIHRDWISIIETPASSGRANGVSLTLSLMGRFTLITFRRPVGLPSAVGVPGFLGSVSINAPDPWQEVRVIAVDLENPTASQATLAEWLSCPSAEAAPPIPQPTIRNRSRQYQMIAAIVFGLAGLGILILSIPTGSAC